MRRALTLALAAALFVVAVASDSAGQIATPARPKASFMNAASGGVSYGIQNDRSADFWGFSLDYSRTLGARWFAAAALTWDSETETFDDRPRQNTKTFTMVGTISYGVTSWMSLTTGLGKGFADTDNPTGAMRFSSGDLATGISVGFSTPGLPQFARDSIGFSGSYEYNITKKETSVSFDVTFGWSF